MRRVCVVAVVCVVAACLWSCGGGGADYSSPKATFNTMWAAAKAGDEAGITACFSSECRKKMDEMKKLMADLPKELAEAMKGKQGEFTKEIVNEAKKAKVEVGAEKIDGDKATLEVTTDGKKETHQFIKEGGAWKLHVAELAAMDIEEAKKGIELMKALSKSGLMKGMEDAIKKGLQDLK